MQIDATKLDGDYPPEPECQVTSTECSFKPIHALCHECGRKLCQECTVGIRHQPRMFKYTHMNDGDEDRIQLHCPDCAASHSWNTTILAAGGGGVALGLLILLVVGFSPFIITLIGLALLAAGAYLLYNEYQLKTSVDASEIGN